MERGKRQAITSFFGGRGLYIALALCVAVTGAAGYLLLFGGETAEEAPASAAVDGVEQLPREDPPQRTQPTVTIQKSPEETPGQSPAAAAPVSRPAAVLLPEEPDVPAAAAAPAAVVHPVQGETVAAFSADALQYSETLEDWRTHDGIDISAPAGTPVVAACSGTVLSVAEDSRLGTTVVLSHGDGCETTYASLGEEVTVSPGEEVGAGQQLGVVGNSSLTESALGAHLHFAVTENGRSIDPAEYLSR